MQRELIPRLLAIGLIGYTIFGVALAIVFNSAHVWPELTSPAAWLDSGGGPLIRFAPDTGRRDYWARWLDGSAPKLIAGLYAGLDRRDRRLSAEFLFLRICWQACAPRCCRSRLTR